MSDDLWTIVETGDRVSEKDNFMKARRKYATDHGVSYDDYIMTRDPATRSLSFRLVKTIDDLNEQIVSLATEVEVDEHFTLEVSRLETVEMITALFGRHGPGYRSDFAPLVRFKTNDYRIQCLAVDDKADVDKCEFANAVIGECRHVHSDGSDFHLVWIKKKKPAIPIKNDNALSLTDK